MPRIVFIGGGSLTWIPRFTHDLLRKPELAGSTVVLMDQDPKALDLMAPYVRRMISEGAGDLEVLTSLDRDEAIEGADFVVSTFMAGGHDGWATDLSIAHKYGIQHPKGMSVGPGGFIQGLKAIPQLLDLAHAMERLCPEAPLFNYTNPMSSITLALQRHSSIKAIGVCPGITIAMQWFADFLGMERDDLAYRAAGVNHLNWVLEVRHKESGEDLLPQIVEKARVSDNPLAISAELYDLFGAFPTPGDDHTSECWPYYLRPGVDLSRYRLRHNFVEHRMARRAQYRQEIEAALAGDAPVPAPRGESLEKLDHMITSILFDEKRIYDLNFMNQGVIENVMPEVVVEAPVQIGAHGFHPLHFGELPPAVAGWVNLLGTVQDLTVRAAVEGDRKLALQALLLDPMCYNLEVQQVRSMMDEMLEANRKWLPAFR